MQMTTILTWTFEEPSKSVDCLDLTISIEKYDHKNLPEKTEPLPIHQPLSNHPHKMVQSIIYSLLQDYKQQNTWEENYLEMAIKLFYYLLKQGWSHIQVKECILLADTRL